MQISGGPACLLPWFLTRGSREGPKGDLRYMLTCNSNYAHTPAWNTWEIGSIRTSYSNFVPEHPVRYTHSVTGGNTSGRQFLQ